LEAPNMNSQSDFLSELTGDTLGGVQTDHGGITFADVIVLLLDLVLLIYTGWRSYDFLTTTVPSGMEILALVGLWGLDIGAVAWSLVWIFGSTGKFQNWVSISMFLIDLVGVGLTGLTVAEYFRDEEGQDVLLFIDNIFRFTQAGSEVSALLGRMPSAVGYQPNLATEMGELQERITSTRTGSITSIQAIYVPADDYTDPAPATAFAHLDATTNLERSIAEMGIYPAVDPLASTSRILDPRVIGEQHYRVARRVQNSCRGGPIFPLRH